MHEHSSCFDEIKSFLFMEQLGHNPLAPVTSWVAERSRTEKALKRKQKLVYLKNEGAGSNEQRIQV